MEVLRVSNLRKEYPTFLLDDVSFSIQEGFIMGFIGENGAGKTTTLKSMLNVINKDGGEIHIFGKNIDTDELEIKKDIAFMSSETFYPKRKISEITNVFKKFYDSWDDDVYNEFIAKYGLEPNKKLDELSTGMRIKYSLALALSHHAKLLILDEPTSGLDPVARDDLLETFQNIIEQGDVSILFSTHITSDLEKCADFVTFIQDGIIMESCSKDDLIDKYRLVIGSVEELESIKEKLIAYKINTFGFTGLIETNILPKNTQLKSGKPSLDDIMIYYSERRNRK